MSTSSDSNAPLGAPRVATADVSVRARLAEIAGDDAEFIAELIGAFIAGGEETLREMQAAVAAGDTTTIARAAHKLKGAAANLHIDGLAAITLDIESRAKAGQASNWREELDKLNKEFARVSEALRGELSLLETEQRQAG